LKFALAHDKDQSMKRSRFSEEQIIGILKEHEAGVSVADLCRKHGVSDASIYEWKAKFCGMEVSEAKQLRKLGGREHAAQAVAGRRHAGECGVEGPFGSGDARGQAESCRASPGRIRDGRTVGV
jgi:putative transposase